MNQKITIVVGVVGVLIVLVLLLSARPIDAPVLTFDECVAAGNPVLESYPRQCRTTDGQLTVEDISVPESEENEFDGRGSVVVEGAIIAIDTEQIALDGPVRITISTPFEDEAIIAVPSMGILLCPAYGAMADAFTLTIGQTIEVQGYATSEGEIVPCESADHYLRVTE